MTARLCNLTLAVLALTWPLAAPAGAEPNHDSAALKPANRKFSAPRHEFAIGNDQGLEPEDEAAVMFEQLTQVLPKNWTMYREGLVFEFDGPNGPADKTKSQAARITFWFSDHFADSTVLGNRDKELPPIGTWGGITRIGQGLFTRNEPAEQLWPKFLDDLFWVLPVDHVAFAGGVDLQEKIDDEDSIEDVMSNAGTCIDVQVDDDGNRVNLRGRIAAGLQDWGITRHTRFLVIADEHWNALDWSRGGVIPMIEFATTKQEKQRSLRHYTQLEQLTDTARANGTRIISLTDYVKYLRQLKDAGRANGLPAENHGNRIRIPSVPLTE